MRGLGTDYVISGPMRGLKKLLSMAQTDQQTDRHGDYMTESVKWDRFSENLNNYILQIHITFNSES